MDESGYLKIPPRNVGYAIYGPLRTFYSLPIDAGAGDAS